LASREGFFAPLGFFRHMLQHMLHAIDILGYTLFAGAGDKAFIAEDFQTEL
jgi:hypothetical protein